MTAARVLATGALAGSGIFDGYRVLELPADEHRAANALRVNDVMLMNASCPRTLTMISKLGLEVLPLEVSGISKIDAGLSCMSLRWFDRALAN